MNYDTFSLYQVNNNLIDKYIFCDFLNIRMSLINQVFFKV